MSAPEADIAALAKHYMPHDSGTPFFDRHPSFDAWRCGYQMRGGLYGSVYVLVPGVPHGTTDPVEAIALAINHVAGVSK